MPDEQIRGAIDERYGDKMSRFNPLNFSIGNFPLPIRIDSHDEYDEKIRSELDRYVQAVSEKFKNSPNEEILDRTREVVDHIKQAIQCERDCNTKATLFFSHQEGTLRRSRGAAIYPQKSHILMFFNAL